MPAHDRRNIIDGLPEGSNYVTTDKNGYQNFLYKEKFWNVPENYDLPKDTKRKRAWELWIAGVTLPDGSKIHPFRMFEAKHLPTNVRQKFKVDWKPILKRMELAEGMNLPDDSNFVNSELINSTYDLATNHLKYNVCSFLWEHPNKKEEWNVSTWSKYTTRSHIEKNGNERDKWNLPEKNKLNKPHKVKRTLKRK